MQYKTLLLLLVVINASLCQISIPLTSNCFRQAGTEYDEDCVYTFDLELSYNGNKYTLPSIVDIQSEYNFVVDQTCSNCFSNKESQQDAFLCGNSCNKPVSPQDGSQHFVGDKIPAVQIIYVNPEASLGNQDFSLTQVCDITQLKDNFKNPINRLYLDHIKAGLGFDHSVIKSTKSSLSQIFENLQKNSDVQRQFSLFFNNEMGRLLIGQTEKFFQKGDLYDFKVTEDEEGKLGWGAVIGPYLTLKGLKDISTTDNTLPNADSTDNLSTLYFDTTTKYLEFPYVVFQRLHRSLFSFNGCTTDQSGNNICDCPSSSTTYVPIGFSLVNDPHQSTLVNNNSRFTIEPDQYLEEIKGGKSSGKCLLLIKPALIKETQDFTFGTSFLSNYYTIYNYDTKKIQLAHSHGFVPANPNIDNNYRIPFLIIASIFALLLILILLCLLKGVKVGEEPPQDLYKPHQTTTVSYLVRSPREIESIQQITKSVKSTAPIGTPIHARVINSAYSVGYPQPTIYGQY